MGGITIDNMEDWLNAGIDGLGIGSTLVKPEINSEEDLDHIIKKSTTILGIYKENDEYITN